LNQAALLPVCGNPTGHGGEWHTGRGHASAAPACGYECPVLATEGGPGGAGDNNGRSADVTTWHPMLAGGGVRGGDISF